MSPTYDCVVVGGGLVGAAAARALAGAGRRVLLLERDTVGAEASGAAAGMLAPQIEEGLDDPLLALALAGRDRHAPLAAELLANTGLDVGHRPCGIALVAFDEARAGAFQALVARQQEAGLEAQWLSREDLARRHPGIGGEALGALFAPRDGVVDSVALVTAVARDAARLGAEVAEHEEVREILITGGRVTGVLTARSTYGADTVVVAAGAWSGGLRGLPRRLPVEPVRGQIALTDWPRNEPKGVLFGRGAYVVPRGDCALLGSTMERAGFLKATTGLGLAHIFAETGALLPALLDLPLDATWSGLRPMTPDGHPIIGLDPEVAGLVYATGHGRNGILLGPITGDIVRDLVASGTTAYDLKSCSVTRFDR